MSGGDQLSVTIPLLLNTEWRLMGGPVVVIVQLVVNHSTFVLYHADSLAYQH